MAPPTSSPSAAVGQKNGSRNVPMPPMKWYRHLFAYVTLGLLCGWYYFVLLLYPVLIILAIRGSYLAGTIFALFLALTFVPLKFEHWDGFIYSFVFDIWREYFDFSIDVTAFHKHYDEKERYIFFETPHGIFPLGQIVSATFIKDVTPNKMICGTGADAIFTFPVMRHLMAWVGTRRANKKSMAKIFQDGHYCAVIPGGIAEMYITSTREETIYLRKRLGTVKLAIQQGAHIVPGFFFGNTRLFDVPGNTGSESFFSKISRKIRASIIFFYGRNFLTVPYRHPIRLVFGEPIKVTQKDEPTDEEVQETLNKVIAEVEKVYKEKRPEWEDRPLVIL